MSDNSDIINISSQLNSILSINDEVESSNEVVENEQIDTQFESICWEDFIESAEDGSEIFILPDEPKENEELFSVLNIPTNQRDSADIIILEIDIPREKTIENDHKMSMPTSLPSEFEINTNCGNEPNKPCQPLLPVFNDPLDFSCIRLLEDSQKIFKSFIKKITAKETCDIPEQQLLKKEDGPFQCKLCQRVYVHVTGLNRHILKHENDDVLVKTAIPIYELIQPIINCMLCGLVFASVFQANDHLMNAHYTEKLKDDLQSNDENESKKLHEDVDDERVEDNKNFNRETTVHYFDAALVELVYECEFCELKFWDVEKLFQHENQHDPSQGFVCNACKLDFCRLKTVEMHWQMDCVFQLDVEIPRVRVQTVFLCNECGSLFKTRKLLYDHRYKMMHFFPRKSGDNEMLAVFCEVCGELFGTAKGLCLHRKNMHPKLIVKKSPPIVRDRQYLCEVCGKSYTQSSHLWQHLRFHRGVKPFACVFEGCTRKFTIRPDLNDHIRKCHTGERPYECKICGKRFLTGSVYYQHRLIHRGERRYGCEDCGKRFYRADALKNHVRIHTGEKPYACDYCPKRFRQKGDKDKHIRARHSFLVKNRNLPTQRQQAGYVPFSSSMLNKF